MRLVEIVNKYFPKEKVLKELEVTYSERWVLPGLLSSLLGSSRVSSPVVLVETTRFLLFDLRRAKVKFITILIVFLEIPLAVVLILYMYGRDQINISVVIGSVLLVSLSLLLQLLNANSVSRGIRAVKKEWIKDMSESGLDITLEGNKPAGEGKCFVDLVSDFGAGNIPIWDRFVGWFGHLSGSDSQYLKFGEDFAIKYRQIE